jgi:DNA-binding CsgD family transcriptional regulator
MTLVFGTQMTGTTFVFVCIEFIFLLLMFVFRTERPVNDNQTRNMILISLLIVYNITGGLLPDPNLPGSVKLQNIIAYGTGFLTPCYFPYYVYKCFGLEKMKSVAYTGVFATIFLPYILFCIVYINSDLKTAQVILVLPMLAGIWVCYRLWKALHYKFRGKWHIPLAINETIFLCLSVSPWIGLPIITILNLNQSNEALLTNSGFLILLFYEVRNNIVETRANHEKLLLAEEELLRWNRKLEEEVEEKTRTIKSLLQQAENFNDKMVQLISDKLPLVESQTSRELTAIERFKQNCIKYSLTSRETEIALLLKEGKTQNVVATELFISLPTVKKHTQNLYEKLEVTSKFEMIRKLTNEL